MGRGRRLAFAGLALAAGAVAPAAAFPAAEPFRIAFVGPLEGPLAASARESLEGLRLLVVARNAAGGLGAQKRPVELLSLDDGDDPAGSGAALDRAAKEKVDAIVAAPTGRTVDALVARARAGRTPVLLVGAAAAPPTLDPASPVFSLVPSPVDEALALAGLLALRSRKPLVGISGDTLHPGLLVEDTAPARALADALERNLGVAQKSAGRVLVPPRGRPAADALAGLRKAGCDRLVLVGEPDLADAAADALAAAGWRVPVLASAGVLSGAAASLRDGRLKDATLLAALPQRVLEPPKSLASAHGRAHPGELPGPRTVLGWMAGDLVLAAAETAKPPREAGLTAALREQRYGMGEAGTTVFDETGRATLFRFAPWRVGEKGPEACNPKFLPQADAGPLLGMRPPSRAAPATPGKVVWITFGDEKSRDPRSIEADLAVLGLAAGGAPGDAERAVEDELLARTLGKLNVLFLKEYDGTPVPGVSFDISFTAERPADLEKGRLWTALVAGVGPPARKGGSHYPGEGSISIHSSWLTRNLPSLARGRVFPPLGAGDLPYLRGAYPWAETVEENQRSDGIRSLVDALAGAFAMKGAKELGQLAGLALDRGPDIRSVMNVDGGEGLRETQLHFTAKDAKALERTLGRCAGR